MRIGVSPVEDFELAGAFTDQVAAFWFTDLTAEDEISGQDQVIAVGELNADHLAIVGFILRPTNRGWDGDLYVIPDVRHGCREMLGPLLFQPRGPQSQHVTHYWLIRTRTVVSVVAAALVTLPICLFPVAVVVTMLLVSSQYKIVPTV